MPMKSLDIFCYYDKQQFTQFGPMDCANWYGVMAESGKRKQALYPAMGRKHISFMGENKLVFDGEPNRPFKTIKYFYVIVGTRVYQIDRFYNQKLIGHVALGSTQWFAWLAVGTTVVACMTDGKNIFRITENGTSVTMETITDPNAPQNPRYVAAFGNRFTVSDDQTPDFYLSTINFVGTINNCFTVSGGALFNRASGVIGQMGVLHNQLYIFTDYTTDVWGNIPTQITVAGATREFPWKLNTSYNWNYGIFDPFSLAINFGRMVWLAKNDSGIVSFMSSNGGQPKDISTQAINVLLEQSKSVNAVSPFLNGESSGFLYQYNNTIFYRAVAGKFLDFGILDVTDSANSIEYNFNIGQWARVIELNGERNRIQNHIFYDNKHLVTVSDDTAMYEMSGNIFHNELRNTAQANPQSPDAFIKYPMRYELVTSQIFDETDYSEWVDDYVEIDFVFGDRTFYKSNAPFLNTVYLVDEESSPEIPVYLVTQQDEFIIGEQGNTPSFNDNHYNALFKPYIELYYSNDGGVTYLYADKRQFSPKGAYQWIMRWYELSSYRNRCYKLVCVSSAPIVILGAVRNTRRVSGGAN